MTRENQTAEARFVFLRAEGLLFSLRPFSLPAHFARNAQAFTERLYRLVAVACLGLARTVVSVEHPEFAARLMHLPLRGMSRDRHCRNDDCEHSGERMKVTHADPFGAHHFS